MQKLSGYRLGNTTPDKALAKSKLTQHVGAEDLVQASAPHDGKTIGYLSQDELDKGAADLAKRYLPASGEARSDGARYRPSVAMSVIGARGAALGEVTVKALVKEARSASPNDYVNRSELEQAASRLAGGPVADSLIDGFSVESHVVTGNPSHMGYEYFFSLNLPLISKVTSHRLLSGGNVAARTEELLARVKKDGAQTLPGGVEARIEQKAPKTSDYFPGHKPPFLVLDNGGDELWVEASGFGVSASIVDGKSVKGSVDFHDWGDTGSSYFDGLPPMSRLNMAFQSRANVDASAMLATFVNQAFEGGTGVAAIQEAATEAKTMRGEALARYLTLTDVVGQYAKAAKHIETNGTADDLGDADMTISIAAKLKNSGKVVTKGEGPLLIFDNHASGATIGVSIDALNEGRLKAFTAYEGKHVGTYELDAAGKSVEPTGAGFTSSIAWNASFWVDQLINGE